MHWITDAAFWVQMLDCILQIGIFCLPQAAVIPLHNHPGMTVFSKLLFGSMHIRSYDWVDSSKQIRSSNGELDVIMFCAAWSCSCRQFIIPSSIPGACLAKLNTDSVMNAPCETSILYPAAGGNMHCFTAVTPCAVLDVLGPPYNGPEGRDCKYYTEVLCSSFPGMFFSFSSEKQLYYFKNLVQFESCSSEYKIENNFGG